MQASAWTEALGLIGAGRLEAAAAVLDGLIEAEPGNHAAANEAAVVALRLGRSERAAELAGRAVALAPEQTSYRSNLCEFLRRAGRLDEAVAEGRHAVELAPDQPGPHYNLGMALYERLEIDAAIASQRRAIALAPDFADAHFELAEGLLLSGRWEEGWQEYEWRFDLPGVPPPLPEGHGRPLWDGHPLAEGRLLLVADQGYGDVIQFCRFIPEAARRCPDLAVACSPEMRPLLEQLAGGALLVDRWEELPPFAAYCPLSGLPRLFGTRPDSVPAPVPYLAAERARVEHWRGRLQELLPKGYRRIGLVWAGRPTHGNDANRSISLATLAPLAALPKVALVTLQMGEAQRAIGGYFGAAPLVNLGAEIRDFADTAAILSLLDHLVTVDTSVAHLAGALGRPVSILLPYAPDWRWLLGRGDTPWYPTARLFRQEAPRQWQGAVSALVRSLA